MACFANAESNPDTIDTMNSEHYGLAQTVGKRLVQRKMKLATAESCTGGGIAAAITDIPGSSEWFERGFVTYSNEAKQDLLGVKADTLAECGAASTQVALEMAAGAVAGSNGDVAVSVTGIAGPDGGSEKKPVGSVWFGLADSAGNAAAFDERFEGDRESVRSQTVAHALKCIIRFVDEFG